MTTLTADAPGSSDGITRRLPPAQVRHDLTHYPALCARCRKPVPKLFLIPYKHANLCVPCFRATVQANLSRLHRETVPLHVRAQDYLERTKGHRLG